MNVRNLSLVQTAFVAKLADRVSTSFRRSLDIRVAEQRARIERSGLAGMI